METVFHLRPGTPSFSLPLVPGWLTHPCARALSLSFLGMSWSSWGCFHLLNDTDTTVLTDTAQDEGSTTNPLKVCFHPASFKVHFLYYKLACTLCKRKINCNTVPMKVKGKALSPPQGLEKVGTVHIYSTRGECMHPQIRNHTRGSTLCFRSTSHGHSPVHTRHPTFNSRRAPVLFRAPGKPDLLGLTPGHTWLA